METDFIRTVCLSFPDVTEDIKWGHDLCFLIGEKMFCVTGVEGEFGVSFKVNDEEFEELSSRDGIIPAPYLARYKWVYVNDAKCFSKTEWQKYLSQSYELIKSKLKKKSISSQKKILKKKK